MRIAHSADMYQRNTISVPMDDKGKQTFRLDRLAPINGFDHTHAHDAMADVEATLFVAKLVKERASGIWESMCRFVNKNEVINYVKKKVIDLCRKHPVYAKSVALNAVSAA